MSDDKNKMGFSGLSSLASEVDEGVAEHAGHEARAQGPRDTERQGTRQTNPRDSGPSPRRTSQTHSDQEVAASGTSRTPTSGSRATKWLWGLVGIGVLTWLFNVAQEDSLTPSTVPSHTPPSRSQSDAPSQTPGTQISGLEFSKPPVGDNNVLSVAQIRWCLRKDIQIEVLRPLPTTNSQIDQFNAVVTDYNSRCGGFRYREGALTRAQREVDRVRAEIVASVPLQWEMPARTGSSRLTLDVQTALTALGYDPGPADGLLGARTKSAIEEFEGDLGLRPTGRVSPELSEQLRRRIEASGLGQSSANGVLPQRAGRFIPTNEERTIARNACAGKKALYGLAAYESCVQEMLVELRNLGRRPDLGHVAASERTAIVNACAGKRVLFGPASYYMCIEEKLGELASVAVPSFAEVSTMERSAIENACAGRKVLYGPAAFYACAGGMIDELRQVGNRPDLSQVGYVDRLAIENACGGKKALYGPAAYYRCVNQEMAALP